MNFARVCSEISDLDRALGRFDLRKAFVTREAVAACLATLERSARKRPGPEGGAAPALVPGAGGPRNRPPGQSGLACCATENGAFA